MSSIPNNFGINGPKIYASKSAVLSPIRISEIAGLAATVDSPTQPLPGAATIVFLTPSVGIFSTGHSFLLI
jgi:hypothetical protein